MLQKILENIGLSPKDAQVYLACLELGTQPASVIAKRTGLKRPTTYMILEGLVGKGLVSEYTGSNVKYFTAVQPDYLLNFVEKQKRELSQHQHKLEEFLPSLNSLANPYSLNPRVRFFEGIDGIMQVMEDTLTAKTPILCYSTVDIWFSRDRLKKFIVDYGKKRVENFKIPLRAIVPETDLVKKYLGGSYPRRDEMTEINWAPKDVPVFTNEVNIYDNKMTICSIGRHEEIGLIIESEEIAYTQRSIFELAWRSTKPSNII